MSDEQTSLHVEVVRAHQRIDDHEKHCSERWLVNNQSILDLVKLIHGVEKRIAFFAGLVIALQVIIEALNYLK